MSSRVRRTVWHPAGRPWLIGAWELDEIVIGRNRNATVAIVGECSLNQAELDRRIASARSVSDVESAVSGAVGQFLLLASVAGQVYARGPLAGSHRIYAAVRDGVTVLADRARTLAWLTSAAVDTAQLAARLACPGMPAPLDGDSLWTGVRGVRPGHAVVLDEAGRASPRAWWRTPEPVHSLADGAAALRAALDRAVGLHARPGAVVGADLSGGFDSTSVCFLAAGAGAKLVTATIRWSAPGSADGRYAAIAGNALPVLETLSFDSAELPAQFAGLDIRRDAPDEPRSFLRSRLQQEHIAAAMAAAGAVCRLTGHGGDDVVQPPRGAVADALRRRPISGLRDLSAYRMLHRWSTRDTLAAVFDRGSYASWVRESGTELACGGKAAGVPRRWGRPVGLPPWATDAARAAVGALLTDADAVRLTANAATPLHHAWLQQIQQSGRLAGELEQASAGAGLPCHSPFLEQGVIEAAVSTPSEFARDPRAYKPLLGAAMHDLLPEPVRHRTSKDHCLPEWHSGLRGNQRLLAEWCDTSRLARLEVIDPELLRRAVLNPELLGGEIAAVEKTLAAEAWLRDLSEIPAYLGEEDR